MMRTLPLVLAVALAMACGRGGQTPPPQSTPVTSPAGFEGAPEGAAGISALLRARHTQDLPGRDALDTHAEPAMSLAWLVQNADTAAVKIRAIRALGTHYPGEQAELIARLAVDAPEPLRAAALRALADWPLDLRTAHADAIRAGVGHEDPRVSEAALAASMGLPAAGAEPDELE